MNYLGKAFSHAIRALRRSPGFTLSALTILTLGISANTAIFSIVNAVLLKPLPFPESGRVVSVLHVPPPEAFPGMKLFAVSAANYLDWRQQNTVFESMAIIGFRSYQMGGGNQPQPVLTALTEPGFFSVLKVPPSAGRSFSADECRPGKDDVIVVSHAFSERNFSSPEAATGRTVELSGRKYRVIGVMPRNFQVKSWFPASVDAWAPVAWTPEEAAVRGNHNYVAIARLKPGVSLEEAQTQMDVISERLARAYPEEDKGWGASVATLRDRLVGDVRPALLTLLSAVGFVLLIACANTANLVLVRTAGRSKELAIRAALGANAGQVILPVLLETLLLSVSGGALGLLLASWGAPLVTGALAEQMPSSTEIHLDGRVLLFTLVASIVTGLLAGLIASWRLTRGDVNDSLKQGFGRTDAYSGGRGTRNALVVSEVALALVLLAGAGLMIRSLWALRRVDPGFVASGVMTMTVPIPQAAAAAQRNRLYDDLLPRVEKLPGVISAGAIDTLPLTGGGSQQPVVIEGRPAEVFALQPNVAVRRVTPRYRETMKIPLVAGRDLSEKDTLSLEPLLISESMARKFWPGENAVGKRLRISFTPEIRREVVGVVGDVKDSGLDALDPVPTIYEPLQQNARDEIALVVRTTGDPAAVVAPVTGV